MYIFNGGQMELEKYLHINDLTIDEFAKKIGIARSTLSLYLNGKRLYSKRNANKIEYITNGDVKADELLTKKLTII